MIEVDISHLLNPPYLVRVDECLDEDTGQHFAKIKLLAVYDENDEEIVDHGSSTVTYNLEDENVKKTEMNYPLWINPTTKYLQYEANEFTTTLGRYVYQVTIGTFQNTSFSKVIFDIELLVIEADSAYIEPIIDEEKDLVKENEEGEFENKEEFWENMDNESGFEEDYRWSPPQKDDEVSGMSSYEDSDKGSDEDSDDSGYKSMGGKVSDIESDEDDEFQSGKDWDSDYEYSQGEDSESSDEQKYYEDADEELLNNIEELDKGDIQILTMNTKDIGDLFSDKLKDVQDTRKQEILGDLMKARL